MPIIVKVFIFLFVSVLLNNCVTPKPEATKYEPKYEVGECAKFDPNKIRQRTEGTPILIMKYKDPYYQGLFHYKGKTDSGKKVEVVQTLVLFAKRYDDNTLTTTCSKSLLCMKKCKTLNEACVLKCKDL
jgi:hypothetical protein